MGIEQFVWQHLGYPEVNVRGEVATALSRDESVDWIALHDGQAPDVAATEPKSQATLLLGSCDMQQLAHYLSSPGAQLSTHLNLPSPRYCVPTHRNAIHFLAGARRWSESDKRQVLQDFPLAEAFFFEQPDFAQFERIIYSPLTEYVQAAWRLRALPHVTIGFGEFAAQDPRADVCNHMRENGVDEAAVQRFASAWLYEGAITADAFSRKLDMAFESYTGELVLIAAPEKVNRPEDAAYIEQHARLNAVLRTFAQQRANTRVFAVDDFLNGPEDLAHVMRSYKREVYCRLAKAIASASALEFKPLPSLVRRLPSALHRRATAFARQAIGTWRSALQARS